MPKRRVNVNKKGEDKGEKLGRYKSAIPSMHQAERKQKEEEKTKKMSHYIPKYLS